MSDVALRAGVQSKWTPEFGNYRRGFGGWLAGLGQTATENPISTTMLIVAGVAAYFLFFRKKAEEKPVKKEEVTELAELAAETEAEAEIPEEKAKEITVEVPVSREEVVPVTARRRRKR